MRAHAALSLLAPESPGTSICTSEQMHDCSPLRGELHAGPAEGLRESRRHGSSEKVKGAVSSDDLHLPRCEASRRHGIRRESLPVS